MARAVHVRGPDRLGRRGLPIASGIRLPALARAHSYSHTLDPGPRPTHMRQGPIARVRAPPLTGLPTPKASSPAQRALAMTFIAVVFFADSRSAPTHSVPSACGSRGAGRARPASTWLADTAADDGDCGSVSCVSLQLDLPASSADCSVAATRSIRRRGVQGTFHQRG